MQPRTVADNPEITIEYDAGEDVLHIFLEPVVDETFFVSLQHQPDIFLRLRCWGSKFVGISRKPASPHLGTKSPAPDAMRQLADELVAQYGQMEPDEISRHQYKAVHVFDDDPNVTWSYEPFSEILYVDLRRPIGYTDYVTADDDPDVIVRRDPQENDRVVGFMVERIPRRFGTDMPDDEDLRALARELVARHAPGA